MNWDWNDIDECRQSIVNTSAILTTLLHFSQLGLEGEQIRIMMSFKSQRYLGDPARSATLTALYELSMTTRIQCWSDSFRLPGCFIHSRLSRQDTAGEGPACHGWTGVCGPTQCLGLWANQTSEAGADWSWKLGIPPTSPNKVATVYPQQWHEGNRDWIWGISHFWATQHLFERDAEDLYGLVQTPSLSQQRSICSQATSESRLMQCQHEVSDFDFLFHAVQQVSIISVLYQWRCCNHLLDCSVSFG